MVCGDTELEHGPLGSAVEMICDQGVEGRDTKDYGSNYDNLPHVDTCLITNRDNVDTIESAHKLPWLVTGKATRHVKQKRRTSTLSPPSSKEKTRKIMVLISDTTSTVNAAPMVMITKTLLKLTTICGKMRELEKVASRQGLYNETIDYLINLAVTDPNSTRLLRRLGTLLGYAYTGVCTSKTSTP